MVTKNKVEELNMITLYPYQMGNKWKQCIESQIDIGYTAIHLLPL